MLFKEIQKKKRQIILKLNLFIDIQKNDSDKETNFHSSVKQDKKELTDDDEGIIFSYCNNDVE